MKRNHWYVVTGGPCSGKTTLLQYLEKIGYAVKYEAARQLIDAELKKGKTLAAIRKNEQKFQKKVLHMKVNQESKLPTQQLFFLSVGYPTALPTINYAVFTMM